MPDSIRITAVPPGNAPDYVREAWVGVEIPLAPDQEVGDDKFWSGRGNVGGYLVQTSDAIDALRAADKSDIAAYWEAIRMMTGHQLMFGTDYCEVVSE